MRPHYKGPCYPSDTVFLHQTDFHYAGELPAYPCRVLAFSSSFIFNASGAISSMR